MKTVDMERDKIDALLAEYRAKGYSVLAHPPSQDLPEFLRGFEPDLIATSPAGNVVVQVKSSPRFDPAQAQRLAEAVNQNPSWRFEVVFVSPPVAPDVPAQEELAADEHVTRMLQEAETLSNQGHLEAAGLVAWSAVETILRRLAQSAAPELERQSSARLLKHLYSIGRVEPEVYEKLLRLMEFRNAVAHGFKPRFAAPTIPEVMGDIRRLQHAA
jgi:REase_AHJR-like